MGWGIPSWMPWIWGASKVSVRYVVGYMNLKKKGL